MWHIYLEHIEGVKKFAGGDEILLFFIGDATHGKRHIQHLVSNRMADQITIAVANLRPWMQLKNVTTCRLAKGTGSHVFDEGSSEILVASQLQAEFPVKNIATLYHGLADVDSVKIDFAHHGPYPGSREWLRGNVARYYLRDLMMREIMAGETPPHLVVRAHYHTLVTETLTIRADGKAYKSELLILPSYCGLDQYATRVTRSVHKITNGLMAYEVVDGDLLRECELVELLDIRTKEVL